jgi:hypothetical protein
MTEDLNYEKQITDANKLGNSLLTGMVAESFGENKKNVKVFGNLKTLNQIVEEFKNEINKLK